MFDPQSISAKDPFLVLKDFRASGHSFREGKVVKPRRYMVSRQKVIRLCMDGFLEPVSNENPKPEEPTAKAEGFFIPVEETSEE